MPEQAVLSQVSGYVYEKRLILKYITENGTDPMNNQALTAEQLVEIKSELFLYLIYQQPFNMINYFIEIFSKSSC